MIRRTKVLYADKQVGYKLVANQLLKKSSFHQLPFQCSMVVPGAVQCTRYQYQPREQKLFKETFKAAGTSGILLPPTYFVNSINTPGAGCTQCCGGWKVHFAWCRSTCVTYFDKVTSHVALATVHNLESECFCCSRVLKQRYPQRRGDSLGIPNHITADWTS